MLVGDGDDRRDGVMFDRGNEQELRDTKPIAAQRGL